jgi:glycosyltransferase involved in cell wall biosynthesis
MKIAIVHEWFVNYAGSEKCVESFVKIWPDADVFALVDHLNTEERKIILNGKHARTSFIQKLPFSKSNHRNYLPLFPMAIEKLKLNKYDLIISSSHSVAKGILTQQNQLHICYCHSPMRYAWDSANDYLKGLKGSIAKIFINYLREWDLRSSQKVNYFIANSDFVAEKIKRIYNRDAEVIYPPVDIDRFELAEKKADYYLTASRMVPYKKIDIVVEAFNEMPDKKLIVIGNGPERKKIQSIAGKNVTVLDHQPNNKLKEYMQNAKAFVFAAEEDFGITVVEAMSCGTPVIALNRGGTAESVIDGKTGICFSEQSPSSIKNAVFSLESKINSFEAKKISENAGKFSRNNFEKNIANFVHSKAEEFKSKLSHDS